MLWVSSVLAPARVLASRPPLTPSADEGRSALRRELLDPAYRSQNPVQELLTWLGRLLDRTLSTAQDASMLSTVVALGVLLLLVLALAWAASRARGSARARRTRGAVLDLAALDADTLRRRAVEALEGDRPADALLDAFRALARRQVQRGVLRDDPGATAHEVSEALGHARPGLAGALAEAAGHFDAVLYGGESATPSQARDVLDLDRRLDATPETVR